jgi:amino acid transporter
VRDRLRGLFLGHPKNLLDPRIHQHLALMAFFAWVGLGSDGLSSSCYGPEEIFRQLGTHRYLAPYLIGAVMATVFLISTSYSHIIEQFPSGGGGYLVATRLLGPIPGLVSGSALVIDYVLTISISVAAGCDALFSFLPVPWVPWKLTAELGVVGALILLNLRGIKESVYVLTPIFLAFIASHAMLITYGIAVQGTALSHLAGGTIAETRSAVSNLGLLSVAGLCLRAFSLGGGTFTGIEAVSNGVGILREPRVENGKRTMLYMSASLAFTAGGILLCYLVNDVHVEAGKTLNASLWELLTRRWVIAGHPMGGVVTAFTLAAEGALLFVAAQTGFVDGPRTLAAMATDQWVPKRFNHLSERLVTQNGVVAMGIAAVAVLAQTRGAVPLLVVMYSINVFLTFTLSQIGMTRHWLQSRERDRRWARRGLVNAAGAVLTATILVMTATLKFREGGWITLVATTMLIGGCLAIRRHYGHVRAHLASLDESLANLPIRERRAPTALSTEGPTAIVLVESYGGVGLHTLLSMERILPRHFRNVVFVSVGLADSTRFKSADEIRELERHVRADLERYVELAERFGWYAEYRYTLGTDLIEELEGLCVDLAKEFRRPIVFAGQLVFQRENLWTRSLHHETSFSIQRRLQFHGLQVIVLPIRVWQRPTARRRLTGSGSLASTDRSSSGATR